MSGTANETTSLQVVAQPHGDRCAIRLVPMPAGRYHHEGMNELPDDVNKIGMMADYVGQIYHQYAEARATQLIYCETVVVYAAIRTQLALRGIPEHEIQFIQDHQSKTKKAALFANMNSGRVRVLLASKQSTGMNIQRRLIALHHLDCPWRPGDLEQRQGRIVRQGNVFPEVMEFAYVVEGSFDGFRWQTVETKAAFISQMKSGDVTVREIDDLGDSVASAAEIKALASGNPRVMEKVKLDSEIMKLEAAEAADLENRVRLRRRITTNEQERQSIRRSIPFYEFVRDLGQTTKGADFKATVRDGAMVQSVTLYDKRDPAGSAVMKVVSELGQVAEQTREAKSAVIARYRNVELRCVASPFTGTRVGITVDFEGESRLIEDNIKLDPASIFRSADYYLNNTQDRLDKMQARFAELDESDVAAEKALAEPWPDTARLDELHERVRALNAELEAASEKAEGAEEGENAGEIADEPQAIILERPAIVLPEPEDRAAMLEAIRILSGAVVDDEAETNIDDAEADADVPEQPEAAEQHDGEAEEPQVLVIPARTLTLPPRTKEPVLVFGQATAPVRVKAAKPRKAQPVPARVVSQDSIAQGSLFDLVIGNAGDEPAQVTMF